ncbi:uncharacterized protein LOC131323316 isoform X1 [Rhododendron vialii]|uniref:uncharacterized protein LOC131323313 isoform X1 n=1 Tax=Rhododendron vialii TaxID=182163 RepID=UPI00265F400A|nr:uncharacterized protein LOC131323313 isoform X1 [Rhododendron vialii]XP_058211017.1 uncharacterized protein LOC131323314 isoform X1 [Rhododendron vialii]XP_058211021.1 uncharacterized protein LOC131323316 isoform X1 [Rhododendron vialii]
MGIRDFISSTTDKLSSPVTAACRSSYNISRGAVTTVNSVVMENVVPTVNYYVSDEEGRAVIGRFATSFVKNTAVYGAQECLKWATGPVYNIASRSLCDVKAEDYKELKMKTDHYKDEVQKLQDLVNRLERKLSGGENVQDDVKFKRESSVGKNYHADLKFESRVVPCLNSNAHLEPEDVIRIFTMKEFISGRFMFDNLVVPGVKKSSKDP